MLMKKWGESWGRMRGEVKNGHSYGVPPEVYMGST
jgi:hypothetical protein